MTHLYFVRHAESDCSVTDDQSRPLTEKGLRDRALVTAYLMEKDATQVASSPYRRAYDTVAPYAEHKGLLILCLDALRERRVTDHWIDDFGDYARRQWADFSYKLPGGESLAEVQARMATALSDLLDRYPGQSIAVGSHGTALSALINHFDSSFSYDRFQQIVRLMPWVVHFAFEGDCLQLIESIDLFARRD